MKNNTLTRELLNMEEIRKIADSPIWNQGKSDGIYGYPLPLDKDFMEIGKRLAEIFPVNQTYIIGPFCCAKSDDSHLGPFKWAHDFMVPDGTNIIAAESGKIVQAIDSFTKWGDSEKYRDQLNYITIQHLNGEYSQYCHVALDSFHDTGLKVGDIVKKGMVIGKVGKNGWTDRDHLHFIVFKTGKIEGNPYNFYSLEVRFEK